MWKIHAICRGLAKPPLHPTEEDWVAHIDLLQRWVSKQPESITARVAPAETHKGYGEKGPGPSVADPVSESKANPRTGIGSLDQGPRVVRRDPVYGPVPALAAVRQTGPARTGHQI